jgi:hypothetical protein
MRLLALLYGRFDRSYPLTDSTVSTGWMAILLVQKIQNMS